MGLRDHSRLMAAWHTTGEDLRVRHQVGHMAAAVVVSSGYYMGHHAEQVLHLLLLLGSSLPEEYC